MALLTLEDGRTLADLQAISAELAPLSIRLDRWPIEGGREVSQLLARPSLGDAEKEQVLAGLEVYFRRLQQAAGYQSRDLIVIHPEMPGLEAMLAKFDRCHTHDADEVRYIVEGEGVFGFVRRDGSQVRLMVEAGEYINVPAGTEHWFILTPLRRIKAVRYFTTTEGWVPRYTGTVIRA
ncbi:MAG TPA: cupin domain-containing protein [Myxococcales bacterium]|nr:cupin domain-containing protein [Myxococcales bacterium]